MSKLLLPFALLLLLSSCRFLGGERVRGNGNIVRTQRNPGNFKSIEASGSVEVHIKQDGASSVTLETDENLLEYVELFTDGNTLVIRTKKGYNLDPSEEIIVYATAPSFEKLDVSGASRIIGEGTISGNELEVGASGASEISMNVDVSKLQADLSGASILKLKGAAANFSTGASGACKIKCIDLATEEATLDISGATNAEITANKQLNIDASGASNIDYRGNANINQKSSGASSVRKI